MEDVCNKWIEKTNPPLTLEEIGNAFIVNHKSNAICICGISSLESYITEKLHDENIIQSILGPIIEVSIVTTLKL